MKVPVAAAYFVEFYRTKQTEKAVYAFFTAVFALIFWVLYGLLPFLDTFSGTLWNVYDLNGEFYREPTGKGFLIFLWFFPMAIAFFCSVFYLVSHALMLHTIKKEQNATRLETMVGFSQYGKAKYNWFMLAVAITFTSSLIPLLSLIPTDLSNEMRVFLVYFISFLSFATYGFRHTLLAQQWAKAHVKEEKRQKKEAFKKEKEQQKEKTVHPSDIEQLVETALAINEYDMPHFQLHVQRIIKEIHSFGQHKMNIQTEDVHMIKRILTEELPAVLVTYDELDEPSKGAYEAKFTDCLQKIHAQLVARNQNRQHIKKLGAEKVIELIQSRY